MPVTMVFVVRPFFSNMIEDEKFRMNEIEVDMDDFEDER
jgi:hypothetical protein